MRNSFVPRDFWQCLETVLGVTMRAVATKSVHQECFWTCYGLQGSVLRNRIILPQIPTMPVPRKAGPTALPCQAEWALPDNSHPLPLLLSQCSRDKAHSLKCFKRSTACFQSPLFTKLGSATWVCPSQYQVPFPTGNALPLSNPRLFFKWWFTVFGHRETPWSSHLLPVQGRLTSSTSFWHFLPPSYNCKLAHVVDSLMTAFFTRLCTLQDRQKGQLAHWSLSSHSSN